MSKSCSGMRRVGNANVVYNGIRALGLKGLDKVAEKMGGCRAG